MWEHVDGTTVIQLQGTGQCSMCSYITGARAALGAENVSKHVIAIRF